LYQKRKWNLNHLADTTTSTSLSVDKAKKSIKSLAHRKNLKSIYEDTLCGGVSQSIHNMMNLEQPSVYSQVSQHSKD
jgi:hypothetical protein